MTSPIKTYILVDLERYKQLETKNKQLQVLSERYSKLQDLLEQRAASQNLAHTSLLNKPEIKTANETWYGTTSSLEMANQIPHFGLWTTKLQS